MKFFAVLATLEALSLTTDAFTPAGKFAFTGGRVQESRQVAHDTELFGRKMSKPTDGDIRRLFVDWNSALETGDPDVVAKLYSDDAVLLPTVSDVPRTDLGSIKDYFDTFLKLEPNGVILDGKIKVGDGWAQDAGIYEFYLGSVDKHVKARYSFVYTEKDGVWSIQHHHSSVMPEASAGEAITEEGVRGLFSLWNDALATLDSSKVADRYSSTPVLLPTVSDIPRTEYDTIKDYFDSFLLKKPQGVILESNVLIGTNWCQDAGIYEFTMGADGSKAKARYSFVYVFEDDEWKIAHHHSSLMPEPLLASSTGSGSSAPSITKDEVRGLFDLWNNALATLDAEEVAKRYSNEGVLLPTVSDTPRTSNELIKDYFESFCQKKPQGVITDGNIIVGDGWAQDAGIYEFTMGIDGSKVLARYSFIYVYEDGEWKISHHHSSVMPEALLAPGLPTPTKDEVRGLFDLWNGALATLDSEQVANRYSKEAVLLPTVSDTPRTSYDLIKDYFDSFCQKKPQGVITEGNIIVGEGWAQDAGVYEFTMGIDDSKVLARYSFIYVYEDGEWKISHHHSSVMPEALLAK